MASSELSGWPSPATQCASGHSTGRTGCGGWGGGRSCGGCGGRGGWGGWGDREERRGTGLPGGGYVGGLQVLVDALEAPLAAEAGLLEATERGRRVGHHPPVQPDHADLEPL